MKIDTDKIESELVKGMRAAEDYIDRTVWVGKLTSKEYKVARHAVEVYNKAKSL